MATSSIVGVCLHWSPNKFIIHLYPLSVQEINSLNRSYATCRQHHESRRNGIHSFLSHVRIQCYSLSLYTQHLFMFLLVSGACIYFYSAATVTTQSHNAVSVLPFVSILRHCLSSSSSSRMLCSAMRVCASIFRINYL